MTCSLLRGEERACEEHFIVCHVISFLYMHHIIWIYAWTASDQQSSIFVPFSWESKKKRTEKNKSNKFPNFFCLWENQFSSNWSHFFGWWLIFPFKKTVPPPISKTVCKWWPVNFLSLKAFVWYYRPLQKDGLSSKKCAQLGVCAQMLTGRDQPGNLLGKALSTAPTTVSG